jgi:hypothetical protein
MILVKGVTYRIERTEPHHYAVVRLLDDVEVGTFRTRPTLRMHPLHIEAADMREVVRRAMRSARTSGVMHVAPAYAPDRESSPSVIPDPPSSPEEARPSPANAGHRPSSAPPPSPALA